MPFGQRVHRGGIVRRHHAKPANAPAHADETSNHQAPPVENTVYGPELPGESTIHLVLDLAMRIAEIQMSSGAGAADATATIFAVTSAYGLPHCEVDVILTSISVCCHRGTEFAPIYSLRVVRPRGTDYTRLVKVEQLVRAITSGRLRATDAMTELNRIIDTPHRYPRWAMTLAWAGMAASIAILLGGGPLVASISAVITAVLDRVGRFLNQRKLPAFFQQLVGGALATGIALGIANSNLFAPQPSATLLIAAAITVLLSGLAVTTTAQDAITGYFITAAGRSVEIALSSLGLIAGVVLALNIAVQIGLPSTPLAGTLPPSPWRLPIQVLAGAGAAAFFALTAYAGPRVLVVAAVAGAIGALVYDAIAFLSANQVPRAAVAAAVIGFCGGLLARRLGLPPVVLAVSGLVPLLPGYSTYHALFQLAVVRTPSGIPSLMIAIAIAVALGAGVVLGEFLAQPVRTGLGRLERRMAGPRMAGPLLPSRRKLD